MRVLATAGGEAAAYPGLLAAIGESLGCAGALWLPGRRRRAALRARRGRRAAAAGAELVAVGVGVGRPGRRAAARSRSRCARIGVLAFATAAPLEPDAALLATMESLGTQISQFVERCRAQQAVRAERRAQERDPQRRLRLHRHDGPRRPRASRSTAPPSGPSATRAAEMVGRDLAELIIPPHLRDAHRRGLARYLRTGISMVGGHPLELEGMRKDGSEFPVEVVVTRADLPGPPLFAGYLRDVTEAREREEDLRRLADEQAALRRVATAVAAETDPRRVFAVVTEEVGAAARRAEREHGALRRRTATATVVGGWSEGDGRATCRSATTVRMDGDTVVGARVPDAAPRRGSTTTATASASSPRRCAGSASSCAVAAPIFLDGRLWGAVIVSSVDAGRRSRPAPSSGSRTSPSSPRRRWPTRSAREELAASRARIVAAGDAERRRLERNLHDGAQQRLVSLALMLRMAARRHGDDRDLDAGRRGADAGAGGAARARPRHPSRGADRARARAGRASRWRAARRCRSRSTSASPSGCPGRSRPPPTTWSPRR